MLNRRTFVNGIVALPLLPFSTYALPLGEAELTTVSDGSLILPGSSIFGPMPHQELAEFLNAKGIASESVTRECNLALYRDGTNTVLFDVGSGPDFAPSAGFLFESLDAAGVDPESVTHVVFTHAHPDHIWGLIDEFDEPVFSEASYLMGRIEWNYWWDPGTVETIGESRASFAVGARRRMEFIEDRVELFEDGEEILPGIAAVASHGHTPGHMSFEVRSGGDAALIVGDAIANHHVAFERPQWPSGLDQDAKTAVSSRLQLLDRLTADRMALVGFHLPSGGIGRAERTSDGYRFIPKGA